MEFCRGCKKGACDFDAISLPPIIEEEEVMDLIPAKPLAKFEEKIKQYFSEKLKEIYEKLKHKKEQKWRIKTFYLWKYLKPFQTL